MARVAEWGSGGGREGGGGGGEVGRWTAGLNVCDLDSKTCNLFLSYYTGSHIGNSTISGYNCERKY